MALTLEGPPPVEGTGGGFVRMDGCGDVRGTGAAVERGARAVRGAVVHDHLLSDWASCCHAIPCPAGLYGICVITLGD